MRLNVGRKSHLIATNVNYSKLALKILSILYQNGVIRGFFVEGDRIVVHYKFSDGRPILWALDLISRPGKRELWTKRKLSLKYNSHNFSGFYIISTSYGLITSNEALLSKGVSGEVLLKVSV